MKLLNLNSISIVRGGLRVKTNIKAGKKKPAKK